MFVGHPIPGNADIRSRPFQQESFYDVPGLMADPRYQESMRLARAEATLGQCHSMLHQIMTHLGLPHDPAQREEPATDAASLDVLAAAAVASPPPQQ